MKLTKEEELMLLRNLSQIEGYLYSIKDSSGVLDLVDVPIELLMNKLDPKNEIPWDE